MAASVQASFSGAQVQQQQQRQQPFAFDLDTSRADPYVKHFVFTFTKTCGWNTLPLRDDALSRHLLLVERVEVTSALACGQPYVLTHDDGRFVGRLTTILEGIQLPRPPSFPEWAEWKMHAHGVCGLDGVNRNEATGPVEALNEERFFLSELYMSLPQLTRARDGDGNHYQLRTWQQLISAHIPPPILKSIRHGSVWQCLKERYLQCPLIKPRPDRPFADLHIHLAADKCEEQNTTIHAVVTVYGKLISHFCNPVHTQAGLETLSDSFIQPTETGLEFEELFRRFPIRFHRDRLALRCYPKQ